jgi:hypothetical protein
MLRNCMCMKLWMNQLQELEDSILRKDAADPGKALKLKNHKTFEVGVKVGGFRVLWDVQSRMCPFVMLLLFPLYPTSVCFRETCPVSVVHGRPVSRGSRLSV